MRTSTLLTTTTTAATLLTLAAAKNTVVQVGEGGLKFTPDNITGAKEGDTLEFHFYPKNHSVVSSTFDKPCVPNKDAIFSGFVPVESGEGEEVFTVTLNDTSKPVWVYCSQGKHCQSGMVMAVNAPTTGNTLEAYKSASAKVSTTESPAGALNKGTLGPASGSGSSESNSTSSTNGTSTDSGTATGTESAGPAASTSNPAALSNGEISSGMLGLLGGLAVWGML